MVNLCLVNHTKLESSGFVHDFLLKVSNHRGAHHVPHTVDCGTPHVDQPVNAADDRVDFQWQVERLHKDESDHQSTARDTA